MAAAAAGPACASDSDKPQARASGPGREKPTLRIAQWSNYIAGYDQWWDDEYTQRWGEANDVRVVVDHLEIEQGFPRAQAEAAKQQGHDIFQLPFGAAPSFEDDVIDHREIVEEVRAKVGPMATHVERSILNPKTGKYFGFSDFWIPNMANYRTDLWGADSSPDTWDQVLAAGRRLKAKGSPIGVGMGHDEESNLNLMGLMHAFGASIQNEDAALTVNTPAAAEAVRFGVSLFKEAMTDEIFGWDVSSNNLALTTGRASLIINALAALRAMEAQAPDLASNVAVLPIPAGPVGRVGPYVVSINMVWKFARDRELAKRFLVDLAVNYRQQFIRSSYNQFPSFPGSAPDLGELLVSDPAASSPGKYAFLRDASQWTVNIGHPGYSNAATDEIVKASIVSRMFARAARREVSAEDAVRDAEAQMRPIFDKWRERGRI